jgi:Icc-related predicted phosphoesterase
MRPVGSVAVRDAINKHQPLLSVHGHIHESRATKKMGRTLAINPGSVYGDGVLQGAVIELDVKKAKVSRYLMVNG